jgi:hypothetical protein
MERKGFAGVGEFGMLASAADAAQAGYGRSGYLSAIERATRAYAAPVTCGHGSMSSSGGRRAVA